MTREEEIMARARRVQYMSDYCDAAKDIFYLHARNKELQRRVENMQAVVNIGRKIISVNDDSIAVLKGEKKVSNKESYIDSCAHEIGLLESKLRKALATLDAKEQDDD